MVPPVFVWKVKDLLLRITDKCYLIVGIHPKIVKFEKWLNF